MFGRASLAFLLLAASYAVLAQTRNRPPATPPPTQTTTVLPVNRVSLFPNGSRLVREAKALEGVRRNTALKVKDELSAAANAVEYIVANTETVRLRPRARVVLDSLPPETPSPNSEALTKIKVQEGTMLVRGSHAFRGAGRFVVETPMGVGTAARGTSFAVTYSDQGADILVAEGEVDITSATDPSQRLIVRHGQKAFVGSSINEPFPTSPVALGPADFALFVELLSLPGSANGGDLQNDIANADISEIFTKRWDPNGRWAANSPPAPDSYDDSWEPELRNIVRFDRPAGTGAGTRFDGFAVVNQEGVRRALGEGFHLQALSPDGKTVYATSLEKGLWAFDFDGRAEPRQISPKPLVELDLSPDGTRLVACVGFKLVEGRPRALRHHWVVLEIASGKERTLEQAEPLREEGFDRSYDWFVRGRMVGAWFEGGKRLIAHRGEDRNAVFIAGDGETPRVVLRGRGYLAPMGGQWIYSPGFENETKREVTVVRVADGRSWTFEAAKPVENSANAWTIGDRTIQVSLTHQIRLGAEPAFVEAARRPEDTYPQIPSAVSPDGRFIAYIETLSDRLIVADAKAPVRLFDTGIALPADVRLTWLPVGDTIAYRRTQPDYHERFASAEERKTPKPMRLVAGEVELGAIKMPAALKKPDGTSDFTANPRPDVATLIGTPSQALDLKAQDSNGRVTGTLKGGPAMEAVFWDRATGVTSLNRPGSDFTAGIDVSDAGLVGNSSQGAFFWSPKSGFVDLGGELRLNALGKLTVGFTRTRENGVTQAFAYDTAAGTFRPLDRTERESEVLMVSRDDSVLVRVRDGNRSRFYVHSWDGTMREVVLPGRLVQEDGRDGFYEMFLSTDGKVFGRADFQGLGWKVFESDRNGRSFLYERGLDGSGSYFSLISIAGTWNGKLVVVGSLRDSEGGGYTGFTPAYLSREGVEPFSAKLDFSMFSLLSAYEVSPLGQLVCVGHKKSSLDTLSFLVDLAKYDALPGGRIIKN